MFFEIAQFVKFFILSPITWTAGLLIAGFLVRKRVLRCALLVAAAVVFLLFTNPLFLEWARRAYIGPYTVPEIQKSHTYDTAIVLGGFSSLNPETGGLVFIGDNGDRLWEAVRLLKEGRVKRLLISGDACCNITSGGHDNAPAFRAYMSTFGVPDSLLLIDQKSINTRENAVYSKEMLDSLGIDGDDCLLVTSAIHMKRSMSCFKRVGMNPVPYPVTVPPQRDALSHRDFYPRWDNAVQWEGIFNEIIGNIVYSIVGYI
ncbi:MAG: YdcF family protein [Muribaculaceae bacterium]|nr:YdcF family protein [Muribaculaceae bacterium]